MIDIQTRSGRHDQDDEGPLSSLRHPKAGRPFSTRIQTSLAFLRTLRLAGGRHGVALRKLHASLRDSFLHTPKRAVAMLDQLAACAVSEQTGTVLNSILTRLIPRSLFVLFGARWPA
jgi:hypothetical protein